MIRSLLHLLLILSAAALAGQTRRALVVGNTDYKSLPAATQAVPNARAFARTMAAKQFEVAIVINAEADLLAREINKFLQDVKPGDAAVFYFSGYAVQDLGENYLLPIGYAPQSTAGIEFQSYSIKRLVRYLETKKLATGIVLVEPAPANAAIEAKFDQAGLATMDIRTANMVLAFANLPGRNIPPSAGREIGLFTEAWINAANEPGASLDAAIRRIKQQVSQATNGEQVPTEISTLVNDFAFQPRSAAAVEWERIDGSMDPATFEAFRRKFPADPLAADAAKRIESLEWQRVAATGSAAAVGDFLRRFPQNRDASQWLAARDASERASVSRAILAAIDRFCKAYESRDIEAVQAARPNLTPAERKSLEQAFRAFRNVKYSLTPLGEPVIEPTAATVKCRRKVEMRGADGGNPPPVEQLVTVKLRLQNQFWIIESIQ